MRKLMVSAISACVLAVTLPWAAAQAGEGPGNFGSFVHERLRIPMRDGITLSADVWRPVTEQRVPVVIQMTPYHAVMKALDRNEDDLPTDLYASRLVRRGYAWAIVDVRGTYNSGGCWDYGGIKERQDGYDTVEWFGTVPVWSNGAVAMIGASYDGTTANAAAIEQPPHLKTIVPISAISSWYDYAYERGARITSSGDRADLDPPSDTPADFMFAYGVVPPPDQNRLDDPTALTDRFRPCARVEQTLAGYADGRSDAFWEERRYLSRADMVEVPVLVAHGLNDWNVKPSQGLDWFQALPGRKVLVAGQWEHALPAYGGWVPLLFNWFDHYLYGVDNGVDQIDPVIIDGRGGAGFDLRSDLGGTPVEVPVGGGSSMIQDSGTLTETAMFATGSGAASRTLGFGGPSRIEGRPRLELPFTTDSPGTRFAAWLRACSSGSCEVIGRAFADARFRQGLAEPVPTVPGERTSISLEFHAMSADLGVGETLELWIASSSNTWIAPDVWRATTTLHLDDATLILPTA
ncbi:MAG: CocE/NonD family hydrolase [Actinomycetota bacterium]